VLLQGAEFTEAEVTGFGIRLRPPRDHRANLRCRSLDKVPILVPDREQRLLSRHRIGLLEGWWELEPRILVRVYGNIAGEVLGAQPEFAISQGTGRQRCAVNETAHGEATCHKEESGEFEGEPKLKRLDPAAHAFVSARI